MIRTSPRTRLTHSIAPAMMLLASVPAQAQDLTDMSLEQLLDISIIGASKYEQKQEDIAADVRVLTRHEIRSYGWRTLNEALASLPGIHTTYDRQYGYLGTRGFGLPGDYNTRVLLTINGNRVNDVVYDAALPDRAFPLDMGLIERIEFIPGPGGAVYGQNALFGVVNVVTRSGAGVDGVELAASHHTRQAGQEGRVSWGRQLDNGTDVLLSASGYHATGEDHFYDFGAAGVSGVARGMDGQKDKEFYSHLAHGPWAFDFSYGDRRKDDPTAAYLADPLTAGQYQRDRSLLSQLQYQASFGGDTLQLTGRLFLGRERYTGLFHYTGSPYLATGSSDWQGVELRLLYSAWSHHRVMLGMEYQDSRRRDQSNEDQIDSANSIFISGSGWRTGLYLQDEWRVTETLNATLGLRLDRNDITGNSSSPRIGLIWRATPDTLLKSLYGRAQRAPNAYEHEYGDGVSQVANPNLKGETIDTLELVVEHRPNQALLISASLYEWRMKGLVVLGTDSGSGLSQYQSGEDVTARGLVLSADKTWGWGGRLRGSLSHQEATYKNGAKLDNSPQLLGKLNFSSPLSVAGLRLGYELQHYSSRQAIDGSQLPGYWLSNLNLIATQWSQGLEVALGIYNLLDRHYDHPGSDTNWQTAIEQDGRSLRIKADYHF